MTDKLRTLKDIELRIKENSLDDMMVFSKELKAEAVKWVKPKNLLKLREEFRNHTGPWITAIHDFESFEDWTTIEFANFVIRKMNNLTEEDLK